MGAQTDKDSARRKAMERAGSMVRAKWHLDKLIGFGGMAAVYSATHEDGHRAALKIMHPELCHDDDIRERFLREGHIARQVDHDGVVRIYDDDITERGEPFLVMELLEGSPLSRIWRKRNKKLPIGSCLHIAAAVLDALAAFHEKTIVHRDLKPANIFITKKSVVKVLDFGVARLREKGRDMTRAGLAMGTPSFMAPEQALGKNKSVDHRADIYAMGATLYTIISGRKLHRGASEQEAYVLAATQPAPSVARAAPDLPLPIVTIIDRALQWDPRNRWQSAEEMRAKILEVLDSELDLTVTVGGDDAGRASDPGDSEQKTNSRPSIPTRVAKPPRRQDRTTGSGIEIQLAFDPPRAEAPEGEAKDRQSRPGGGPARPIGVTGIKRTTVPRPEARAPLPSSPSTTTGTRVATGKSDDVPLAADHPLVGLFVAVDRLLRTARQYGPSHPETQNRLPAVIQGVTQAVQTRGEGLKVKVLPFCFSVDTETVWEPTPPGDIVPYTLSVAGLREFTVVDGVGEEELRELFGAMMIDANSNPSEIATSLWEAPFQHIQCKIEEELGGEDAESLEDFFAEAAVLEKELTTQLSDVQKMALSMQREDVMEAAALAAMTKAAERSAEVLGLDEEAQERLTAATRLRTSELRTRHDEVLLDAFGDAAIRRDVTALVESVNAYSRRQVRLGRDSEVYSTHKVLMEKLRSGKRPAQLSPSFITATLFPADVLSHVVRTATGYSTLLSEEQRDEALSGFAVITRTTSPKSLPTFLELANRLEEGPVFELLLEYIQRASEGEEQLVFQRLEEMGPLVAQTIMKLLLGAGGDRVKPMLQPLLESQNTALRCEAIAQLAASDIQLTQELMKLFKSPDQQVRWAALDTFVRHSVLSAGPALVAVVEDKSFRTRSLDEQQRVFDALFALHPGRAEALLTSLIASHGLMRNDELERTRTLAARMLGEHAKTAEALAAVRKATGRGWWNSPELREVAILAASQIEGRIATGGQA